MEHRLYELWSRRGEALYCTIQQSMQQMQVSTEDVERKATLLSVLASLQTFGQSQLNFFLNGFDRKVHYGNQPNKATVQLEPSTAYPPEYAMRVTIDQIAYDLDVIQRAYQQRLPHLTTSAMRETLTKADILAYRALLPAIEAGLIENTTVVTYFQKSVNVRIIPYAPVTFVGLPISALTVQRDLLAIPHEIGHYIYRHGKTQQGEAAGSRFDAVLAQELQHLPGWCQAWIEEIFADVYGALVGGPVMALGFEDLVVDDSIAEFTFDDGEHPISALRPDIYHRVYERREVDPAVMQQLKDRWQRWLAKRGNPTKFRPAAKSTHNGSELGADHFALYVQLKEARELLYQVTDRILQSDLQQLPLASATDIDGATGADIERFFTRFEGQVAQLPTVSQGEVPEVELTHDDAGQPCCLQLAPLSGKSIAPFSRPVGQTGLWIDAIKETTQDFNMPPEVWMALLDGSGWAVEGPGLNAH